MHSLLNKLRLIIQAQQRLIAMQPPLLHHRVNEILARRSENIDEIDHLMDDLFPIMQHGFGTADFQRLNAYLATLDPEAAEYYQQKFEEWHSA